MSRTYHVDKAAKHKATCPCVQTFVARRRAARLKKRHQNRVMRAWGAK